MATAKAVLLPMAAGCRPYGRFEIATESGTMPLRVLAPKAVHLESNLLAALVADKNHLALLNPERFVPGARCCQMAAVLPFVHTGRG